MVGLWILALVSLLSLGLAHRVVVNLKLVEFQKDKMKCLYAAKAAINKAVGVLENEKFNSEDHPATLNQLWSMGYDVAAVGKDYILKEVKVGDALFTVKSTGRMFIDLDGAEDADTYGMTDEDRKLNINTAKKEALRFLFENCDADDPDLLAEAITYWRGDNPQAVDPYYGSATVPYQARKAPFQTMEELAFVKGFRGNKELISLCGDFLSVFPDAVNVNTAGVGVLRAIFTGFGADDVFSRHLALNVREYRSGSDGMAGTDDDRGMVSADIAAVLKDGLTAEQIDWVDDHINDFRFTVTSQWFRIEATAIIPSRKIQKKVDAVVSAKENYRIVYWHEE